MSFLMENGEIYNCQFKKRMKASKNFLKTYEAAKPLIDERNETIHELVCGTMKSDATWGHFIATENQVYFIVLKKKKPILKNWPYKEIIKITASRKPLIGHKIDFKTAEEDLNINSISEGDIDGFIKYVESKISGNEERYESEKEDLKKETKEYYFKSAKTTITLDGNYIRVARKGAVNTITRGYSGEKSYRISELSGLQIKKPGLVTSGYFQFLTPAANETSGLWDAIQDDNSFTFGANELPMVLEIQKYIEEHQSIPAPTISPAPAPTVSAADELKKYKELLDMDAITQEEYEIKKKQLLNL
ncbi:hypothetical protein WYY_16787 [Bacillus velezensis M27]|uniref:SHOCT domain-containing protein n=1 Tax=Bacillus velezensis TaxID=492670 RepID=UPI0002866548|nr:SHOCT domain-containing protein [Bacillus velezensis]EKE46556.1 hypothetical protein WYY_16787 [Bacillus velezensis M27]